MFDMLNFHCRPTDVVHQLEQKTQFCTVKTPYKQYNFSLLLMLVTLRHRIESCSISLLSFLNAVAGYKHTLNALVLCHFATVCMQCSYLFNFFSSYSAATVAPLVRHSFFCKFVNERVFVRILFICSRNNFQLMLKCRTRQIQSKKKEHENTCNSYCQNKLNSSKFVNKLCAIVGCMSSVYLCIVRIIEYPRISSVKIGKPLDMK